MANNETLDLDPEADEPLLNTTTSTGEPLECYLRPQVALFHVAYAFFLASYCIPDSRLGKLGMHFGLMLGYFLLCSWSWNVICAPDVFSWYFTFMVINLCQLLFICYQMRPIRFDSELTAIYEALFEPLNVTRIQFKKLISAEHAQILHLHPGECYAIDNMTKTNRLGLVLSGRMNVLSDKTFLHDIKAGEFLDSPEFESSTNEDVFRLTLFASVETRYVMWDRANLEYFFVKDPFMGQVMSAVLAQDIAEKLYAMNSRIKNKQGKTMDLRLPGIAAQLYEMNNREHAVMTTNMESNKEKNGNKADISS